MNIMLVLGDGAHVRDRHSQGGLRPTPAHTWPNSCSKPLCSLSSAGSLHWPGRQRRGGRLSSQSDFQTFVTTHSAALATGFSAAVCVFFRIYPATRGRGPEPD